MKRKADDRGITLTELIIVTAIIGILALALGFSFQGWQGAYKVEKTIKEIYADLTDVRQRAVQTNRSYFADFPTATTYRMSMDDSNGIAKADDGDGVFQPQANPAVVTVDTDTTLPTFPKTVAYPITWTGGTIVFNTRGHIQPSAVPLDSSSTLYIASTANPDYDCIVVSPTRINMGKWNAGTGVCDEK